MVQRVVVQWRKLTVVERCAMYACCGVLFLFVGLHAVLAYAQATFPDDHGELTVPAAGDKALLNDATDGINKWITWGNFFTAPTITPKATISNSATTAPLNITERSAAPSSPATNDVYLDDGTNTASGNPGWRRYNGSAWEDVSGGSGTPTTIGSLDTSTLTITSGAVTKTTNYHTIAAESGTTDDLDTISGGTSGDILFLKADTGDTITLTSSGNIFCEWATGAKDYLVTATDVHMLFFDGSKWRIIGRSRLPSSSGVSIEIFGNTIAYNGQLKLDAAGGTDHIVFLDRIERTTSGAITASTTQSQGQQPLTSDVNNVSVCANANDVVTLPAAIAGHKITVINSGAQILQVFPASGDDLGAGVNASTTIAAGASKTFVAYDATNWKDIT